MAITKRRGDVNRNSALRKRSPRKAAEMAGHEVDRLGDETATRKERAQRKRNLIRGPQEFREMREDLPKTKN